MVLHDERRRARGEGVLIAAEEACRSGFRNHVRDAGGRWVRCHRAIDIPHRQHVAFPVGNRDNQVIHRRNRLRFLHGLRQNLTHIGDFHPLCEQR